MPVFCAPARNRTQINGSEDRCVIHYTTGAYCEWAVQGSNLRPFA